MLWMQKPAAAVEAEAEAEVEEAIHGAEAVEAAVIPVAEEDQAAADFHAAGQPVAAVLAGEAVVADSHVVVNKAVAVFPGGKIPEVLDSAAVVEAKARVVSVAEKVKAQADFLRAEVKGAPEA
jgi:putative intracellular protease/amidase